MFSAIKHHFCKYGEKLKLSGGLAVKFM